MNTQCVKFVLFLIMGSLTSCHLWERGDDEKLRPKTSGVVKGIVKYRPKYIPAVVCDTCDFNLALQTTLYFTKKEPYYENGKIPMIIDSTTSNHLGEFSKVLPAGHYSLFASFDGIKYNTAPYAHPMYGPPYALPFTVYPNRTTEIYPVFMEDHD